MHNLVSLVTLASLLLYFWTSLRVGQARGKYKIEPPATTGDPEFERHFRVQANTGEWMLIFLPSLWLFAINVNDNIAAAMGLVWMVGRVMYALGYVKEPKQRSTGFLIQSLAVAVLLFGAIGFIIWHMVQPPASV